MAVASIAPERNVLVARRYYDAFNRRALDEAAALVADDLEWTNHPLGAVYRGPAGFRRFLETYATAFPDSHTEVTSVVASGDRVIVEFIARGTHTGPLAGPVGDIRPTGRSVAIPLCEVLELRDGRIVAGRSYWDAATMMRQLGLV
jgi:steroid delta-isomerase-like uncharacterized protein